MITIQSVSVDMQCFSVFGSYSIANNRSKLYFLVLICQMSE